MYSTIWTTPPKLVKDNCFYNLLFLQRKEVDNKGNWFNFSVPTDSCNHSSILKNRVYLCFNVRSHLTVGTKRWHWKIITTASNKVEARCKHKCRRILMASQGFVVDFFVSQRRWSSPCIASNARPSQGAMVWVWRRRDSNPWYKLFCTCWDRSVFTNFPPLRTVHAALTAHGSSNSDPLIFDSAWSIVLGGKHSFPL